MSKRALFKQLEFLGYDPVSIRNVLLTKNTFEDAVAELSNNKEQFIRSELVKYGVPVRMARRLSACSNTVNEAYSKFTEYLPVAENIRKTVQEFGYPANSAEVLISEVLPYEIAIDRLLSNQVSNDLITIQKPKPNMPPMPIPPVQNAPMPGIQIMPSPPPLLNNPHNFPPPLLNNQQNNPAPHLPQNPLGYHPQPGVHPLSQPGQLYPQNPNNPYFTRSPPIRPPNLIQPMPPPIFSNNNPQPGPPIRPPNLIQPMSPPIFPHNNPQPGPAILFRSPMDNEPDIVPQELQSIPRRRQAPPPIPQIPNPINIPPQLPPLPPPIPNLNSSVSIRHPHRDEEIIVNRDNLGANFNEAYETVTIARMRRDNPEMQIEIVGPGHPMFEFLVMMDLLGSLGLLRALGGMYQDQGLEEEQINGLRRENLSLALGLTTDNCVICMEDFEIGTEIVVLSCLHGFHVDCIKTWLAKSTLCPLCKHDLSEDFAEGK